MMNRVTSLFKITELRNRLFYTLGMLAVFRLGIYITTPGVDRAATRGFMRSQEASGGGFLSLFNFFSGGALENASVFALGIMPYITASIIMTMMAVVVPAVERMQKEGEQGRRKINQWTRYGTIVIATVQGIMIAQSFKSNGVVNPDWAYSFWGFGFVGMTVITLAAGTAFLMWLGERITERGIGNGISLIIFAGIVARLPNAIYATFVGVKNQTYQPSEMFMLGCVMLAVLAAIVFIEEGQRRLPVQYAKRIVGNRQYGGQATHLPLKINVAGVIPPIFASTILMFPMTLASFWQAEWLQTVQQALMPGGWHYQVLFVAMIIFFAFFYTAIQFNPVDVADNMRKFGGFIPGIRPGKSTSDYIDFVLTRLTFAGALYLSAVCVVPQAIQSLTANQVPFYFGGTGLLIVVSVALETVRQIESHYIGKQYEGMTGADPNQGNVRIRARLQEGDA